MRTEPSSHTWSFSRGDLLSMGWTSHAIADAVRAGTLIRARNGVYLTPEHPTTLRDAARVGGRLTCVSLLSLLGVFVLDASVLHVHLPPNAARQRSVQRPVARHWDALRRTPHPRACVVEAFDAVVQAVRCQTPRAAVATLDSALRRGVLRADELGEVFAALPRRYRVLRRLLDPRAESGPESLVRLLLRQLGCRIDVQVSIHGVGRVDFVVDGWLIVECDSEEFHSGWDAQRRDRRRDQAAAALGYATYRPVAEDIMWHPESVLAALRGLVRSPRARTQDARARRAAAAA